MKTWVRKTLSVGVLAAGALLFAPGAAHADAGQAASDNNGILNATQIVAPINAPLTISGVGVGILGEGAGMGGSAESAMTESGDVTQASSDSNGAANGTQVYLPVNVPVSISGVGVGILGEGTGSGSTESAMTESGEVTQASSGNVGAANGSQVYLPVNLPINLAGVGIGILGEGTGSGSTESATTESGDATQASTGSNGVANGTQVYAPLNAPLTIGGVGLGVLGTGTGTASGSGAGANSTEDTTQVADGSNGVANGTQVAAPVNAPVCIAGVGIGILGQGTGSGSCDTAGGGNGGEDPTGGGNGGYDNAGGSDSYGEQSRSSHARKASQEALPTDVVTQSLNGQALNLGGLDLLSTLR